MNLVEFRGNEDDERVYVNPACVAAVWVTDEERTYIVLASGTNIQGVYVDEDIRGVVGKLRKERQPAKGTPAAD